MKKVLIVSLAFLLVLPLIFSGGTSKAMKKPGRIDGVDYTRIRENKDLSVPIEFQIGVYKFEGELVNGTTLSKDEIDKVIDQVMKQMDLTPGKLEFSADVIEQAKHLKGFDPAAALRIGLSVAGFGTMYDIYDMYQGKKEIPAGLAGIVIGELSGQAVNFLTGKKWADVVLNAFLATKDIAAEWTRIEKEREIAELAMQREMLLSVFYDECNRRLEKLEKEKGSNNWKIKVNDARRKDKTLFGIGVKQIMWLKVDMERVNSFGDKTTTNWSGIYEGSIEIQMWHDLTQFDNNFPTLFTDQTIFKRVQHIYDTRPDSVKEKSTLTKKITIAEAQIHIDKRNAVGTTLSKNISLAGAEDVSKFQLNHVVTYALSYGPWDDGHFHASGSGVSYDANVTMEESCSGDVLEINRYPAIIWNTHQNVVWDSLTAPLGVGWGKRELAGNGKYAVGSPAIVDYQIFNDLRDNQMTLWIKNIKKEAK
ncbi:MAG: hypothetical protein IK088_07800 [Lachnospiraceae bacterium]|nr:hypothetical protein [Lachnospiraceae bacterium]